MTDNYTQYQAEIVADVSKILAQAGCQPILFIGSGFAKRYAGAPNWDELLEQLAKQCSTLEMGYGYYKQKTPDPIDIGSQFSAAYVDWAWTKGKAKFPETCFAPGFPAGGFIKTAIADILKSLGPTKGSYGSPELDAEIKALKNINPHAIITTNYDELLEPLFPNYERVIGQQILAHPYFSIGEIFKIHGCISDPLSLVLTREDYTEFAEDKKYLSAKLLTYFAEHPLLFIGYSAHDPNIKAILYDISRIFKPSLALSPNIYVLEWDPNITEESVPPRERVLMVGDGVEVRIKSISASSFKWVYKAFATGSMLQKVNLKALRALMARTVNLIRKDVPSKNIEVNFEKLEHAVQNNETFGNLLGITLLDNPAAINANFPYTGTMLAKKLGITMHAVNQGFKKVLADKGVDIKSFDNAFHWKLKTGGAAASFTRKYSERAATLISQVLSGKAYEIPANCKTIE